MIPLIKMDWEPVRDHKCFLLGRDLNFLKKCQNFDPEKICLRFWDILGCQVQNVLKTLGKRFSGRDLHFLKKKCQKWVRKKLFTLLGHFEMSGADFPDFGRRPEPINFPFNSFLKSLILEVWPPNPDFPDFCRCPELINFLLHSFLKPLILEPWPPHPDFPDCGRRPETLNFLKKFLSVVF